MVTLIHGIFQNNKYMKKVNTTINTETLTIENLRKALDMLEKQSLQPFLVCIKSKYEWYSTIKKSPFTYSFLIHGTPIYKDDHIPDGIIRFEMSDGSFQDVPYKDNIKK